MSQFKKVMLEGSLVFLNPTSKQILREIDSKNVELDFSDVDAIDSIGIDLILKLANSIKKKHGQLRIINVNKPIYDLMSICELSKIAEIQVKEEK